MTDSTTQPETSQPHATPLQPLLGGLTDLFGGDAAPGAVCLPDGTCTTE